MADLNSGALLGTDQAPSGFNFENVGRNARLMEMWAHEASAKPGTELLPPHGGHKKGPGHIPQATKTGTTIAGIVFKNGVILGADTRATNGDEVADKNCEKIHYISDNMYCCGAGTAADTEQSTGLIASQLELLRMDTHAASATSLRVISAVVRLRQMLFRYQGYVSAALILGGVDKIDGPQLYSIYPHGSSSRFSFTSMGSGCLAAMAVLETSWRPDMEEEEAVKLVQRAITAGIFNDLGSGSNCDITIIRTDGSVQIIRPSLTPNKVEPLRALVQRSARLNMNPGTTPILGSSFVPHRPNMATLADVTVTAMEE